MIIELNVLLIICSGFIIVESKPPVPGNAEIKRNDFFIIGNSGYILNVETSDGFRHYVTGYLKDFGTEDKILTVTGSYSYIGPDAVTYTVRYTADENGFKPYGLHIPQFGPPPASSAVSYGGLGTSCIATLCGTGLG